MVTEPVSDAVANNTIYIYVTIILGICYLLLQFLTSANGSLSKFFRERRRSQQERNDDYVSFSNKRQRDMQKQINELLRYMQKHNTVLYEHMQWDNEVMADPTHAKRFPAPALYPQNVDDEIVMPPTGADLEPEGPSEQE